MFRVCAAILLIVGSWATACAQEATPAAWRQRLADAGCYRGVDAANDEAAAKACPDMRPFLRVETGMHVAPISRSGVNAACTRLATASNDKTVRIWSLPDGRLEQTIRLPIGPDSNGMINATALSPDGRTLAAGGWDAYYERHRSHALYVVDIASGAVRRFGDLPNVIGSVAFSADGSRVAVGLFGSDGVRVFDVASGRQLMRDLDYGDNIYALAFGPDGSLFSVSYDGRARRYGAQGRLEATSDALASKSPFSVAIRPDGARIAVGFHNSSKVEILDARTLKPIASAETDDIANKDLGTVAWSSDGAVLAAAGSAQASSNAALRQFIRRFDANGRRSGADAPAALNTVTDLHACGDGFLFTSAEPSFGLMDSSGRVRVLQAPHVADMRGRLGDAFTVSPDGERVRFGLQRGNGKPVLFDLAAATLSDSATKPADLSAARVDGLAVKDWQDGYAPTLAGARIPVLTYELSRSLAVRRDGRGFTLGTGWYVRAFDADGIQLWRRPVPAETFGVNTADDDNLVLAAYSDGTIRWLNADTGAELLALFVEPETRRWVAWTPSGYYMASAGGEDLIGWQLNRGWTQRADFFPASHFQGFNRPDVVQLVLATRDEAEAVRQANAKSPAKSAPAPETALPPVTTIAAAGDNGRFSGESVEVSFDVRSPSGAAIDRVEVLVDGVKLDARGLAPPRPASDGRRRLTIPAPPRDFELALIAYAGALAGEPAKIRLTWTGGANQAAALKPKLYVVAIGVSDYVTPELQLTWANEDARGFAEAIKGQAGGLYSEVVVLPPLTDRAVTRPSVMKALRWLNRQATSRDTGMVLIAGHGTVDESGNYYFLPSDATRDDLEVSGVSQDDILREMRKVSGKAILFLDTCHANQAAAKGVATRGDININNVINEFSRTENGLVVFSASTGKETSREKADWRHGAFTKALIEGLGEGKADLLHHGAITLSELDVYIAERVKQLTDGEQHPVMTRPATMPDFPFAVPR